MAESPQQFPSGRFASLPLATQIKLSKRSWWEVMFLGGDTLAEWQTAGSKIALPVAFLSPHSKWEDVNKARIVAARLWCPDGRIAEVRSTGPNRVLQFKVGSIDQKQGHVTDAHVLGILSDDQGGVTCWEWLPQSRTLRQFTDNFLTLHLRYRVGPFSADALDLKL